MNRYLEKIGAGRAGIRRTIRTKTVRARTAG